MPFVCRNSETMKNKRNTDGCDVFPFFNLKRSKIHKRNVRVGLFPFIHSSSTFCAYVALKFEIVVKIIPSRKMAIYYVFNKNFGLKKTLWMATIHNRCELEKIVQKKFFGSAQNEFGEICLRLEHGSNFRHKDLI